MEVRYVVVAFLANETAQVHGYTWSIFDQVVGVYEDKEIADEVAREHAKAVVFQVPYYKT